MLNQVQHDVILTVLRKPNPFAPSRLRVCQIFVRAKPRSREEAHPFNTSSHRPHKAPSSVTSGRCRQQRPHLWWVVLVTCAGNLKPTIASANVSDSGIEALGDIWICETIQSSVSNPALLTSMSVSAGLPSTSIVTLASRLDPINFSRRQGSICSLICSRARRNLLHFSTNSSPPRRRGSNPGPSGCEAGAGDRFPLSRE